MPVVATLPGHSLLPLMKHFLLSLILAASPVAADQAVEELLAQFQNRLESHDEIEALCESLDDYENSVLDPLIVQLDQTWPIVRDRYLTALLGTAKGGGGSKNGEIRELRSEFMTVYRLDEAQMKPKLKSISMPSLEKLQRIVSPTPKAIIVTSPAKLKPLRDVAYKLAKFRDAALDAALSSTPTDSVETLESTEKEIASDVSSLPRSGLKILEKNRQIAKKEGIPADEAQGIEECNLWRLYVGLNALELDPKLCEAARDHSKDMSEQGFFAHNSPVRGKTTPWDRAKNFGTTASGENIYAGSSDPHSANSGWFYSPGHHKNMFKGSHHRIGLGRHGRHWTQLFGR